MAADPEPLNSIRNGNAECPMMKAHSHAAVSAIRDVLELQRRMRRIGLEKLVILTCKFLNFNWQGV